MSPTEKRIQWENENAPLPEGWRADLTPFPFRVNIEGPDQDIVGVQYHPDVESCWHWAGHFSSTLAGIVEEVAT
jgi:hypothetical protein